MSGKSEGRKRREEGQRRGQRLAYPLRSFYPWSSFALVLLFIFAILPRSVYPLARGPISALKHFHLSFLPAARDDAGAVTTETRDGRLAVFDDVWETISERYYDPSFHGVDWRAQRELFRPQAAQATGPQEFYTLLRRMLGSLRDAHTRVYAPDETFDWQRPRFLSVGMSVREVAGQPVVIQVERGSEAERAGLRAGDLILRVDGEAALALFARRLEEQAGFSTVAATRLHAMAMLFAGPRDSVVEVRWLDAAGSERTARLRRQWRERDATLHIERVKGDYAVVRFDAFTEESARDLLREVEGKFSGLRGLVLDLRNNGGGEAQAMAEIASAFLPVGSSLGQFTDRTGRVTDSPETRAEMLFAPLTIKRFPAPLVILTSERTSSAAEIFAAALKESHRAPIIGAPTCGCVLAIRHQHALPDGGELDVSELDYTTAHGQRLEGQGITPDETIKLTRTDLQTHHDRALERALSHLKNPGPVE